MSGSLWGACAQKAHSATARVEAKFWREPPHGTFLHGTLHVIVHEARGLPDVGRTDPYVRMSVDGKKGMRTRTINNDANPVWEEELRFRVGCRVATITLKIKDEDIAFLSTKIGLVPIPIELVLPDRVKGVWLPVRRHGELRVTAWFVDARQESLFTEVPSTFPEVGGNKVTLYQDANVPADCGLPDVILAHGHLYAKTQCLWVDLHKALREARHFIYVAGWSVWQDLQLVRPQLPAAEDVEGLVTTSLGDLLKRKAEEGVRVLLLVWDEPTSFRSPTLHQLFTVTKTGLLGTHDKEIRAFFHGTKVHCELVPRRGKGIHTAGNVRCVSSTLKWLAAEAMFSHHQKAIVCDAPGPVTPQRRVVAFLGGLDVTSGRFDTPAHPIFSTLGTTHAKDFYQGYGAWDAGFGPRQPWHDVHARVEGPAAWHIVANFEQRWRREAPRRHRDLLVRFDRLPFAGASAPRADPGSWRCQVFRSIDSYAADLPRKGLDRGVYDAYIHHIRRADQFIYIENQYFLGSSQEWEGFDERDWNVECKHRIPAELTSQVVGKIRTGKRFAVYIVIPLHPEGPAEEGLVQAILHWQYKTVGFMYRNIAAAIHEFGPPGALPTDYLNFYCLGQREPAEGPAPATSPPRPLPTLQAKQLQSRRQMLYVHSKMMVVDDEYILIGSANINERSMAGDRDTELCIGTYQPDFMRRGDKLPGGQVAGFRLSLWGEHMNVMENVFYYPGSLQCVQRINQLADFNWDTYAGEDVCSMTGHLCKYPYAVSADGVISPAQQWFPDMEDRNAFIIGRPQAAIPNILTT